MPTLKSVFQVSHLAIGLWDGKRALRFLHPDLLGVLRTLVFYINFRQ